MILHVAPRITGADCIALVVSGVLALALFGAVAAGPLEDGEVAYRSGDYAAAMSYWRALADQGNARAQYDIV